MYRYIYISSKLTTAYLLTANIFNTVTKMPLIHPPPPKKKAGTNSSKIMLLACLEKTHFVIIKRCFIKK